MRIRSKWKDYYDFVSHKFGADPDVLYERKALKQTSFIWANRGTLHSTLAHRWRYEGKSWTRDYISREMRFLVVGNRVMPVLVIRDAEMREIGTHAERLILLGPEHDHMLQVGCWEPNAEKSPKLPTEAHLAELTKLVGAPVYLIREVGSACERPDKSVLVTLDERIPVLANVVGFAAAYPPEQVWQDIYATITNVLRDNPDKKPPVEVAERYRIEAAGFDLKTSFRHPINQQPKKRGR